MKKAVTPYTLAVWVLLFYGTVHPDIDKPADFALQDAATGETVKLGDHLGKRIVVLHFWKSM